MNRKKHTLPVATLLPPDAVTILVNAAAVAGVTVKEVERERVINNAVAEVHRRWPAYFKPRSALAPSTLAVKANAERRLAARNL